MDTCVFQLMASCSVAAPSNASSLLRSDLNLAFSASVICPKFTEGTYLPRSWKSSTVKVMSGMAMLIPWLAFVELGNHSRRIDSKRSRDVYELDDVEATLAA